MILTPFDGDWLAVRQADHGLQTGTFAAHWGNEATPSFDPPQQVIAAAARHDDGWIDWGRPRRRRSTQPAGDPGSSSACRHTSTSRSTDAASRQRPTTTRIRVCWSACTAPGLYNDRYGTFRLAEQHFSPDERVLVDEFLAEQALFQQSLAERAFGREPHTHVTTDPNVWSNYLLLQVWDRLSLQYAYRLAADGEIRPVPLPDGSSAVLRCINQGRFSLSLDPYPFDASSLTFPVTARRVPDRQYRTPEEFLEVLSAAPVDQLECRATRPD